jgi:RimK-like ATP-grasp domain.
MKKILMILDHNNIFKGSVPTESSLDVEKMVKKFNEEKYEVTITTYNDILKNIRNGKKYENHDIIYTSSETVEYKHYLDDILYILSEKNNLIPRYEIFRAHENKGFQELLKLKYNIFSNNGYPYASPNDIERDYKKLKFPLVYKTLNGACSKGVFKVDNKKELLDVYDTVNHDDKSFLFKLKMSIKKKFFNDNLRVFNKAWYWFVGKNQYFVLQDFIPDLDGDWKVLVFNNKYYALKRSAKEGDFRASGSGLLDYEAKAPDLLLNFAKEIYDILDIPFISLDIAISKNKKGEENCHLIEFQGTHFGPVTLTESKRYYAKNKKTWNCIESRSNLEDEYVSSYIEYINRQL